MENEIVSEAISDEIVRLAQIIKDNPGCYLEVNKRDGNDWTLYKEEPDWGNSPEDKDKLEAYSDNLRLATADNFDFPGISGLDVIDPVLYEAMAKALNINLAPEE